MRLRFTRRAREDLTEIGRYLAARDPAAALKVRDAIQASLRILTTHPRAGREVGPALYRFADPRLPYLVFYRHDEEAGAMLVVTIRHAARQPEEEGPPNR